MTPETVRKLLDAFKLDVTVEEACLYANISKDTYYRKLKEDDEFSDEIGRARMYATLVARNCVVKHVATDPHLALKYLERKRPDEFSPHGTKAPDPALVDLGAESTARMSEDFMRALAEFANPPSVHDFLLSRMKLVLGS